METHFIVWLAPWVAKMNQILRCDWLPERKRWRYLARSGLRAVSRKYEDLFFVGVLYAI